MLCLQQQERLYTVDRDWQTNNANQAATKLIKKREELQHHNFQVVDITNAAVSNNNFDY